MVVLRVCVVCWLLFVCVLVSVIFAYCGMFLCLFFLCVCLFVGLFELLLRLLCLVLSVVVVLGCGDVVCLALLVCDLLFVNVFVMLLFCSWRCLLVVLCCLFACLFVCLFVCLFLCMLSLFLLVCLLLFLLSSKCDGV